MTKESESPRTLVTTIVAAYRAGNRELAREVCSQLKQPFQVELSFTREANDSVNGGKDAI